MNNNATQNIHKHNVHFFRITSFDFRSIPDTVGVLQVLSLYRPAHTADEQLFVAPHVSCIDCIVEPTEPSR